MSERPSQDRPRMLLVEDDRRTSDVFVDMLAPLGIEVMVAMSKASAESLIDGECHVAVCDLQIPSHDGWLDASAEHGESIVARLRSERSDIPVVIFSGYSGMREGEHSEDEGLEFFNKSQLPECLARVKALLGMVGA